jgi:hypothetical protein
MKVLHLTLKKKWFDMIASGEKQHEYREIKPYWDKRLVNRDYDAILFRNGYNHDSPKVLVEYAGRSIGIGCPAWGAPSYMVHILSLGNILELN